VAKPAASTAPAEAADAGPKAARRRGGGWRGPGWRSLGWFWAVVGVVLLSGGTVLQILGPVGPVPGQTPAPVHATQLPKSGTRPPPQVANAEPPAAASGTAGGPSRPGAIPPPDPGLLEPSSIYPGMMLPRKAADGRRPMAVFARGFDAADHRPRIALLIDGIGLSFTDSMAAVTSLPGPVSFAVSPYTVQPAPLLDAIRSAGHEFLVSIPMEPEGYPLNDEGLHELLSGAEPAQNAQNLEWALSRLQGYVGATGALDGLRGERYAAIAETLASLEDDLAVRGLLYIDPRPGAPPPANVAGRGVDMVVDDPPLRAAIEAKLASLEQFARDHGSALGLAGPPRPVTLERLVAWANGLGARGLDLVPVSALAQPPAGIGVAKAGSPGDVAR
jgi:polysaccharide deacetylase 2 family uncharacterized protein YibQ